MTARVRLTELPPAMRRQLTARGDADPHHRPASAPSAGRTATGSVDGWSRWRCHACGQEFNARGLTDLPAIVRDHMDTQRHTRVELLLP